MNILHLSTSPAATIVVRSKDWRDYLMKHDRNIFVNGTLREIKSRSLGAGMVELYTKPLKPL